MGVARLGEHALGEIPGVKAEPMRWPTGIGGVPGYGAELLRLWPELGGTEVARPRWRRGSAPAEQGERDAGE